MADHLSLCDRGPVLRLPVSWAAAINHLIGGTAATLFPLFWRPTSLDFGDSLLDFGPADDPPVEIFTTWPPAALALPPGPIPQTADQLAVAESRVGDLKSSGDLRD